MRKIFKGREGGESTPHRPQGFGQRVGSSQEEQDCKEGEGGQAGVAAGKEDLHSRQASSYWLSSPPCPPPLIFPSGPHSP